MSDPLRDSFGRPVNMTLATPDEMTQLRDMLKAQWDIPIMEAGPSPFSPEQRYDYASLLRSGAGLTPDPNDFGRLHAPSEFKTPDHPNRFVLGEQVGMNGGLFDSIMGQPVRPGAVTEEQVRQMLSNLLRFGTGQD